MAITIPTILELQRRISTQLIQSINTTAPSSDKQVDPNIKNSFIKGLVDSMSAGFDENNDLIRELLIQIFPWSATDEFLDRWLNLVGLLRIEASIAEGNISFQGTATTAIPVGTVLSRPNGVLYETTAAATLISNNISITSITRVGSTATATTASDHGLGSSNTVTISGADQTEYNLTDVSITVTGTDTFTYTVSGSPTSPATGTILSTFVNANVPIESQTTGADTNGDVGTEFTLASPISGVNDQAYADFSGVTGGLDRETDSSARARLIERMSSFSNPFSVSGLPVFIKNENPGVTRVFVQDATPEAGKVTIYFTRDDDPTIIPDSAEILAVKNSIINTETGVKPPNTPDVNIIVAAPTPVTVDFTFSSLTPNSLDMQNAITESLVDFFRNTPTLETDITEQEYLNAIFSSLDSQGNVPSFTLSAPSGTISVGAGSLAVLGDITFP